MSETPEADQSAELHMYRNQIVDWFIATSAEHAAELAIEHYAQFGEDHEEMDLDFEQEPDDKLLTLRDGAEVVGRRTAAEWARLEGIGHFATTND